MLRLLEYNQPMTWVDSSEMCGNLSRNVNLGGFMVKRIIKKKQLKNLKNFQIFPHKILQFKFANHTKSLRNKHQSSTFVVFVRWAVLKNKKPSVFELPFNSHTAQAAVPLNFIPNVPFQFEIGDAA